MAIGSALLWSESTDPEPDPPQLPRAKPLPSSNRLIAAALSDRARAVGHTAHGIGRRVASRRRLRESLEAPRRPERDPARADPERGTSPLNAPVGRRRQVAFVDHPLDAVRRASHALGEGVTINDLLLGVIAGGLRHWLEARHGSIGRLRVQVPVSMHREGEAPGAVPNRDSFVNIDLPVQEADAARRVLAVNEQMRARKQDHDAEQLYTVFADVGHVSKHLFDLAHRIASNPHIFALSVSNVRGPAARTTSREDRSGGLLARGDRPAPRTPGQRDLVRRTDRDRPVRGRRRDPGTPRLAKSVERSLVELTEGVTPTR